MTLSIGLNPQVKWCLSQGKLQKALGADTALDIKGSAINFSYSDSGLLGVTLVAKSALAGKVRKCHTNLLRLLRKSYFHICMSIKLLLLKHIFFYSL